MKTYDYAAWQRLGAAVRAARRAAGIRDSKQWASKVGRSARVLQGLERGETVGDETLELVERALEWPVGKAERVLLDPTGALEYTDGIDAFEDAAPPPQVILTETRLRELLGEAADAALERFAKRYETGPARQNRDGVA